MSLIGCPASYEGRDVTPPKSRIDIHNDNIGRAAIEHGQQCSYPAKRSSIANARRDGNDRTVNQTADNTGKSAIHAGYDDNGIRAGKLIPMAQHPMNAGHANIGNQSYVGTQSLGGYKRLPSYGQVRCACC